MKGERMDRNRHLTQDAAEHYAVWLMAKEAEDLGVASHPHSVGLWQGFEQYLTARGWNLASFAGPYPEYKRNVDVQIPAFVRRLKETFPGQTFLFAIDEKKFRDERRKADFTVHVSEEQTVRHVSLKNYIGTGGVSRPQVSSGTFLSFANGFVFDGVGVGTYRDPRPGGTAFKGSVTSKRNAVLEFMNWSGLIEPLQALADFPAYVREKLFVPELRKYNEARVREIVDQIYPVAQDRILAIFDALGEGRVREKFLERAGLHRAEDVLYFDQRNVLDSINDRRVHAVIDKVHITDTPLVVTRAGQSLRFSFGRQEKELLVVDVPLTINTNGAWYRDGQPYEGTQRIKDKQHYVDLEYGELRPYKSKEIATSTNTYINWKATGIFDD